MMRVYTVAPAPTNRAAIRGSGYIKIRFVYTSIIEFLFTPFGYVTRYNRISWITRAIRDRTELITLCKTKKTIPSSVGPFFSFRAEIKILVPLNGYMLYCVCYIFNNILNTYLLYILSYFCHFKFAMIIITFYRNLRDLKKNLYIKSYSCRKFLCV